MSVSSGISSDLGLTQHWRGAMIWWQENKPLKRFSGELTVFLGYDARERGKVRQNVCLYSVRVLILGFTGYKELSLALRQHHGPCCYGNLFPVCLAARHIDSGTWTRKGIADFSVYPLKKYAITLLSSYYFCNLYEIVYKTPMLKQIKAHSELSGRSGNKMLIWIDLDSLLLPSVPDCSLELLMELLLGIKTAWGLEAELQ